MGKQILFLLFGCCMFYCNEVFAAKKTTGTSGNIYYISQGGIDNHANPDIPNSIAWYFKNYGTGNTYILITRNTYYKLNSTLTIPENSTLQGADTIKDDWQIGANSGLDNATMLKLQNGSAIRYLHVNGNRLASTVVSIVNTIGATVSNCDIFDSKNNFTSGKPHTILIFGTGAVDATIESCVLKGAGSGPKLNPGTQSALGYGIILWHAQNALVQNNIITSALTCGIDFTNASTVRITGNTIDSTGLNFENTGPIADGLTAYHNCSEMPQNFTITNNTIINANNHGIHVSGTNITIENNTITNHQLSGVMVDDWRDDAKGGHEVSAHIIIKNNKVDDPTSWARVPGNSNRKIYVDRVDSTMLLDYKVNLNVKGNLLSVTDSNYHLPVIQVYNKR